MRPLSLVLAHQGGWDEILLILTPILIFAGLLWIANRRANAEIRRRETDAAAASQNGPTDQTDAERDDRPADPPPP